MQRRLAVSLLLSSQCRMFVLVLRFFVEVSPLVVRGRDHCLQD